MENISAGFGNSLVSQLKENVLDFYFLFMSRLLYSFPYTASVLYYSNNNPHNMNKVFFKAITICPAVIFLTLRPPQMWNVNYLCESLTPT